jgi:hypothetical protein
MNEVQQAINVLLPALCCGAPGGETVFPDSKVKPTAEEAAKFSGEPSWPPEPTALRLPAVHSLLVSSGTPTVQHAGPWHGMQ